ncbi:alpha/beta fold hydrolase [Streptomyces sp. PTD5-9]|uniref:alpha/beta fold hydrolase n=1 Tax=Streptomyces sp. PTD5-9 TaxID=3120150 RepID=UPI003009FBA5
MCLGSVPESRPGPRIRAGSGAGSGIGTGTGAKAAADVEAIVPFPYGRWDAAAQAHAATEAEQTNLLAADAFPMPGAFDPAATRAAVARLDAPVLVLAGELDGGPLPRVAADIAKSFPHGELAVQPGAGHYPRLDDPDRFARTVADFLGRVGGSRPR